MTGDLANTQTDPESAFVGEHSRPATCDPLPGSSSCAGSGLPKAGLASPAESWRPHMTDTRWPTPSTTDSMRRTALVAGVLYLITFIAVGTLTLYGPVLRDAGYILTSGDDTGLRWGTLLEVIVALAGVGTALALFPVVKRQNEAFALGFVTTRVIE